MRSKLFQKNAYGLDVSGEVYDQEQKNIEDTVQPVDQHQTPHNVVNQTTDVEAQKDFPGLGLHQNRFPHRSHP
jgi:hypothetical protein